MRAPPNAAAVVVTTVMPTWTVAKKRSGSARSAATVLAPARVASTSCCTRVRRSETMAISAPANTPFATMSARMTNSSVRIMRVPLEPKLRHDMRPSGEAELPRVKSRPDPAAVFWDLGELRYPARMLDHVSLRVQDFPRALAFYRAALAPIGYTVAMEFPERTPGWASAASPISGSR